MRNNSTILEAGAQIVVSVADARWSDCAGDVLVTHSLGSCVGVALYDPTVRIAGLLHFQLPSSAADAQRAREKPLMYADTGMKLLLGEMERLGCKRKHMRVKLAGAAEILNNGSLFNIGARNHTAIRKFLWQNGMFITAEDIGGSVPRTVYLHVDDGTVIIKTREQTSEL